MIGGMNAPAGKWPDVAAILYNGNTDPFNTFQCSGVLVAPTVVLTAGHCDPHVDNIGALTGVLLGTTVLASPTDGEIIAVGNTAIAQYPSSQTSIDISIIRLPAPAAEAPRPIAVGWARLDIQNGAKVEFVGYGATDKNANNYIPQLQQAESTITDFNCTTSSGCNTAAHPNGELGAGGMGIDTCPGDSGGPMYLVTDYGTFLAGITSRSYDNAQFSCSEGGIYGRPDKIADYIEMQTGVKVARAPEPTADPISATRGDAGETLITANDPKSEDHTFAITTPPVHGTATVRADGRVRVCTDPAMAGSDSVVVTVTDSNNGARAVPMTIPIAITDGTAPASCNVDDFSVAESGGCCDASRSPAGSLPLALGVLILLRRRRP